MTAPAPEVRRTRARRPLLQFTKERRDEIIHRVLDFYNEDREDREIDRDQRLQRYSNYRQWTEGKNFPWSNSSDQAVPDMTEVSLRTQDTLYNAVLSGRPAVVTARAIKDVDEEKTDLVDSLLDTQFFVEQEGDSGRRTGGIRHRRPSGASAESNQYRPLRSRATRLRSISRTSAVRTISLRSPTATAT